LSLRPTAGQFPANFCAFQRESIDFPAAFLATDKLLKRTLDIRLLTLLAKLSILNRDVKGSARWIGGLAWLLSEHSDGAHPSSRLCPCVRRVVAIASGSPAPLPPRRESG
jgi:hypothetical protein